MCAFTFISPGSLQISRGSYKPDSSSMLMQNVPVDHVGTHVAFYRFSNAALKEKTRRPGTRVPVISSLGK